MTAPIEYSIRNGAFLGYCQVQREAAAKVGGFGKGKETEPEHDWLFFAIDLRQVTHIRQHSPEHPEWCELYQGNSNIATINASATDIAEPWLKVLHAFERIPTSDEARQSLMLQHVQREAIPAERHFNIKP